MIVAYSELKRKIACRLIKMSMSRSNMLRCRLALLKTFHMGSSKARGQQHAQKGPHTQGTAHLGGRTAFPGSSIQYSKRALHLYMKS